jgi:hypothetical protein
MELARGTGARQVQGRAGMAARIEEVGAGDTARGRGACSVEGEAGWDGGADRGG